MPAALDLDDQAGRIQAEWTAAGGDVDSTVGAGRRHKASEALGFEHGSKQGCELVPGEVLLNPGHDLVGGGLFVVGSELELIHSGVVGHRRSRLRAKSLDWKRNDRTGIRSMIQEVFQAGDRVVFAGREDLYGTACRVPPSR